MKLSSLLYLLLIIFKVGKGQCDSIGIQAFTNDSITFSLVYSGGGIYAKNGRMPGYYVDLKMSNDCREILLSKDGAFWMGKLQDSSSDWAANLILYYLFGRDASILLVAKDRTHWLRFKSKEMEYWEDYFESRK